MLKDKLDVVTKLRMTSAMALEHIRVIFFYSEKIDFFSKKVQEKPIKILGALESGPASREPNEA